MNGLIPGATESLGTFCSCDLNSPLYEGECQVPSLGINLQIFDGKGKFLGIVFIENFFSSIHGLQIKVITHKKHKNKFIKCKKIPQIFKFWA